MRIWNQHFRLEPAAQPVQLVIPVFTVREPFGQSLQKLGAKLPWPRLSDKGRYEVTKLGTDRMIFKVPSLRNVEKTAPYFHDGRTDTLAEAVRLMGKHQLGIELEDREVKSITTWLRTLTGEIPVDFVRQPKLPALTPKQVR